MRCFAWLLVCAPEVVGVPFGPQRVQAVVLVLATAALGAAIAIGHPLGQEVRRALAGRGRRTGSA